MFVYDIFKTGTLSSDWFTRIGSVICRKYETYPQMDAGAKHLDDMPTKHVVTLLYN